MHRVRRLYAGFLPHHAHIVQTVIVLMFGFFAFSPLAYADVTRLISRSVLVVDTSPGATTKYSISFTYNTIDQPVGSIDLQFCYDPIPYDPCVTPTGFSAANATLTGQSGEAGFGLTTHTTNHLVISRAPDTVGNTPSTYTFSGMVNPTTNKSFAIRISDFSSTDATGTAIDVGSVIVGVNSSISITTQVPPILYFCVAHEVSEDCTDQEGGNFADLGALSPTHTLTATSQMAVGTNASGGYVITANGPTMEAGTNVIDALTSPKVSTPGNSQFGINLVTNSTPAIGDDPDGAYTNAVVSPGYNTPNKFMYNDGDIVASAPNVSLVRRFTVSYIINVPPNLRAGVYTTSITYICTGRF